MRATLSACLVVFTTCAFGQSSPPAFEVASVKAAPPPTGGRLMVGMNSDAGRVNFSNVTLRNLLTEAYKIKDSQISGPDWLGSERYNIVAKIPAGTPKDQIPLMLQTLLAERFKVTTHRETKVMGVYALVAGKNAPKLHESETEKGGLRMSMGPKGRQMTGSVPLSRLADVLSNMLDRPVLDMTEIKGTFDIDLSWTPDDSQPKAKGEMLAVRARQEGGGEAKAADDGADGPSIFAAVQEKLGLKLEARKLPVELLVIDHAEKVPTEN